VHRQSATYPQVIHTVHKNAVKYETTKKKSISITNNSIASTLFCVYEGKHFVAADLSTQLLINI